MPKILWCASGMHLAIVGDDIVVLDLLSDRYLCLLDGAGLCSPKPDGSIFATDDATASVLLNSGIAVEEFPKAPRNAITPALRELTLPSNPSKAEIFHALGMWAVASIIFRRKTLAVLAKHHVAMRGRTKNVDETRLGQIAGAARRARPWVPFEGECLKRSFQLRCLLASRGIASDWIFGVRTWPFAAHCWIQVGDLVVGDRLERVQLYAPIMSA